MSKGSTPEKEKRKEKTLKGKTLKRKTLKEKTQKNDEKLLTKASL